MIDLKSRRLRQGWSQAELARRAHMNSNTISQIESGRLVPYPGQLAKLAAALGVLEAHSHLLIQDERDQPWPGAELNNSAAKEKPRGLPMPRGGERT